MLRGIEVGEQSNFRTAVLLQALKNEEELAHLRTMISYKSSIIDRTSQKDIDDFNEILNHYNHARNPSTKRKSVADSKIKTADVKALSGLDFSRVKFKGGENPLAAEIEGLNTSKNKEGTVKII